MWLRCFYADDKTRTSAGFNLNEQNKRKQIVSTHKQSINLFITNKDLISKPIRPILS